MEQIVFVGIFVMIVAGLYSVYSKRDERTHSNETDSEVQGCEEAQKVETPEHDEETPASTGGY